MAFEEKPSGQPQVAPAEENMALGCAKKGFLTRFASTWLVFMTWMLKTWPKSHARWTFWPPWKGPRICNSPCMRKRCKCAGPDAFDPKTAATL